MKILRLNRNNLGPYTNRLLAGVMRLTAVHTGWEIVVGNGALWLGFRLIKLP